MSVWEYVIWMQEPEEDREGNRFSGTGTTCSSVLSNLSAENEIWVLCYSSKYS